MPVLKAPSDLWLQALLPGLSASTLIGILALEVAWFHVERLHFQMKSACPAFSLPSFLFVLHPFLKCNIMPKNLVLAGVFLFSVPSAAVLFWAMVELIPKSLQALWLRFSMLVFVYGIFVPIRFWISNE